MSNVKLAIRIRPFTEKELRSDKDRVPVVEAIDDNTITITNIKVSLSGAGDSRERTRRYYADYTFDSSCAVTQTSYATQNKVFESIGRSVISSVSQECSACVLAYGQSATGKTYTMMGTESQPGLIPRLCKALFEEQKKFQYTISFLEIYNERVHDLLCGEAPLSTCNSLPRRKGNARKDLRVREHPQRGTYVQNLRRVSVHDVEGLLALVAEGVKRRRTAATKRNCTSSRSHALLEIATPHATLHLADLAGSEKASWEGCPRGRQKEGANINKSLVALSNVISALVNGGACRGRFVPYRDSALTWLLKDCFTGGANTYIIATVSPSTACYGESASTLRWAARARQLPTPRATHSGSIVATKAALQAQFNQLIAELTLNHIRYNPETGKITFDDLHWRLYNNDVIVDDVKKSAKIGNIMNINRPITDANNSESTASSVASGSSDVINTIDKNITDEVTKEIDNLFGPVLERTCSGDELKVVAPLRHKRRQCRSQEVLVVDKAAHANKTSSLDNDKPSNSEMQINKLKDPPKQKVSQTTILHDNQRAEIVASVTERLYSKLKKKEEATSSKIDSIVEKKIVEPLSELKICTNARQRLIELSQKAIRNRRKIGIPAYTQTRNIVTRVKDKAIDVQRDLHSYVLDKKHSFILSKDVAIETIPMTARYKDICVGPTASLNFNDKSTETKPVIWKNSFMMTDNAIKSEKQTQTQVVPPPRRKKTKTSSQHACHENCNQIDECTLAPVISINISQTYPVDSESQSSDSDSQVLDAKNKKTSTPDLLTSHSTPDTLNIAETGTDASNTLINLIANKASLHTKVGLNLLDSHQQNEEFSDNDDFILPRVIPDTGRQFNESDIKNMILGRSENIYPYNIVISPTKERDSKRLVKFKDIDVDHADVASKDEHLNHNLGVANDCNSITTVSETDYALFNDYDTYSDSTQSSKVDTDSFIWKKGGDITTLSGLKKPYMPVYKNLKYKTTNTRITKDFLEKTDNVESSLKAHSENRNDNISSSDRGIYSKSKFKYKQYNYHDDDDNFQSIERKLYDSCNNLEESLNKYENYIVNTKELIKEAKPKARRPKEYLKHLVQLRREAVKVESDNTDSSVEVYH